MYKELIMFFNFSENSRTSLWYGTFFIDNLFASEVPLYVTALISIKSGLPIVANFAYLNSFIFYFNKKMVNFKLNF